MRPAGLVVVVTVPVLNCVGSLAHWPRSWTWTLIEEAGRGPWRWLCRCWWGLCRWLCRWVRMAGMMLVVVLLKIALRVGVYSC